MAITEFEAGYVYGGATDVDVCFYRDSQRTFRFLVLLNTHIRWRMESESRSPQLTARSSVVKCFKPTA